MCKSGLPWVCPKECYLLFKSSLENSNIQPVESLGIEPSTLNLCPGPLKKINNFYTTGSQTLLMIRNTGECFKILIPRSHSRTNKTLWASVLFYTPLVSPKCSQIWELALYPYNSKCGLWSKSIGIIWELVSNAESRSCYWTQGLCHLGCFIQEQDVLVTR